MYAHIHIYIYIYIYMRAAGPRANFASRGGGLPQARRLQKRSEDFCVPMACPYPCFLYCLMIAPLITLLLPPPPLASYRGGAGVIIRAMHPTLYNNITKETHKRQSTPNYIIKQRKKQKRLSTPKG